MSEYEKFYDVCDELVKEGKTFDAESLKRLKFGDLMLAGCGNAGKAFCKGGNLIREEEERRLSEHDNLPIELLEQIVEDDHMRYALYRRRVNKKPLYIKNAHYWVQLVYYMKKLRGNWSGGRSSTYFKKIIELIPKAKEEALIPIGWVEAVGITTEEFDGEYADGRIFRDGGTVHISKETQEAFHLPKEMTKGSGNIASYFGIILPKGSGFYGGYEELFKKYLTAEQKLESLRKITRKVLS